MRLLLLALTLFSISPLGWADRFQEAADFYASRPAHAFRVEIQPKMPENSPMQGFEIPAVNYRIAAEAPNRIALRAPQGAMEPSFLQSNGSQFILLPFARSYVMNRNSDPVEQLIREEQEMAVPGGSLLIGIAFGDKSPLWKSKATALGDVVIAETPTIHYRLEGAVAGELWIAAEGDPVIVRYLEPTQKDPAIEGGEEGLFSFTPQLDFRFSDWGAAQEEDFSIAAPVGFEAMGSVEEAMQRMQGTAGHTEAAPHPGRNKPAPDVTLHPMGREPLTLASLKGRVVVLDFWASWCKPCVIDLPAVIETVGAFPEEKIAFYAVNRFENEETIQTFIDEEQLTLPVALDPENKIAGAFQVSAIPHLVVIDAEGIVRYIHVGMALGGGKSELRTTLEQLIGTAE